MSVCQYHKQAPADEALMSATFTEVHCRLFFFSSGCAQAASATARLDILESSQHRVEQPALRGKRAQLEHKHSGACLSIHFTNLLFTDKSAVQSSATLTCFDFFFFRPPRLLIFMWNRGRR